MAVLPRWGRDGDEAVGDGASASWHVQQADARAVTHRIVHDLVRNHDMGLRPTTWWKQWMSIWCLFLPDWCVCIQHARVP